MKLSAKYFRPFEVLQRVGNVAYKLKLPVESRIHPVFHVFQLKKKVGQHITTTTSLPLVDVSGSFIVTPIAVLDSRHVLRGNNTTLQLLIHWAGAPVEDSTWEDTNHIHSQFPDFILEDMDLPKKGVLSCN
ncbi:uncharacterized protein LOC113273368 [Papaver somniferum]|uniref:uncharacterized protein LOC113273368 n=1 Tax=Papaver somniferum TaxID=3469 RepID=UPI000E70545B|nr:uncharacterized protein LOC113273368 [Papaver somniferum]